MRGKPCHSATLPWRGTALASCARWDTRKGRRRCAVRLRVSRRARGLLCYGSERRVSAELAAMVETSSLFVMYECKRGIATRSKGWGSECRVAPLGLGSCVGVVVHVVVEIYRGAAPRILKLKKRKRRWKCASPITRISATARRRTLPRSACADRRTAVLATSGRPRGSPRLPR